MMRIGNYLAVPGQEGGLTRLCEDDRLRRHLERPWFRAYLRRRLSLPLAEQGKQTAEEARVPESAWERHGLLVGATGSGKTRALLHTLMQSLEAGCSVVALDPKGETADLLLTSLVQQGFPAERVTLLDPRRPEGVLGWNPFCTGLPVLQAAADFHAVLERSNASWGPRMSDMLQNALIVIGVHRLSLYELARLLVREDYREQLLARPVQTAAEIAYEEARTYFREEFAAWGRSERASAVSPLLNKVRELLRSSFLRPLLCARRNTLDLARLWQEPRVILACLDRPSLGEEGARLLAGLLTNLLFRTALRVSGPVPVLLAVDELPVMERFVGGTLEEIVTVARSRRLRCLVAAQHLAQVSDSLRAALLANCGVQAFLRLGHADARGVAASLAAGTPPQVTRLTLRVDREDRDTGLPELASWRHPIRDAYDRPLWMDPGSWNHLQQSTTYYRDPLIGRQAIERVRAGRRLYVHSADTKDPVELRAYVAGLQDQEYRIEGPALQLAVSFPRPRLTDVERRTEAEAIRTWTACLQDLKVQEAVLRLTGEAPRRVRFADVPNPSASSALRQRFLEASMGANSLSPSEVAADLRWRSDEVERVATGKSPREERRTGRKGGQKGADDGSID